MIDSLIIGSGPAGLMAAEVLSNAGYSVILVDAMPSFGRKFLMAGKSGLNLTKDEPFNDFIKAYGDDADWLAPMILKFGPTQIINWANDLKQEVFIGSTKRVFPKSMKASPLLRNWLNRLLDKNVTFITHCNWLGWKENTSRLMTEHGFELIKSKTTVLALGGASWARLGSNGAWAKLFQADDIPINPFKPTNMGFLVPWSKYMKPYFGHPIKSARLCAGENSTLGEFVISAKGIEGGGIYALSRQIREGAHLFIDFCPNLSKDDLYLRLKKQPKKASRSSILRKVFRLNPAKIALVNEFSRTVSGKDLVETIKNFKMLHLEPYGINKAISTAGGVAKTALNGELMLYKKPSVFCAGEMLDWEAPTGGYLLTACFATGRAAGLGACNYLSRLN